MGGAKRVKSRGGLQNPCYISIFHCGPDLDPSMALTMKRITEKLVLAHLKQFWVASGHGFRPEISNIGDPGESGKVGPTRCPPGIPEFPGC